MSVSSVMAGYAFVKITMDDAELKRGLDSAQKKFKAFAAGVNAWSSKMAGLAPLIAAPMVMSLKTFSAFDDRMRQVQAVTGATGEAFAKLTDEAKRLGRETSFTAAQVSEGMLALGRMGLNPKEIEAAILPMMNLSRVTGTELGQAAEIAANNMRVFGLEASKMSHVADILSVTANSSAQTLVDLGESLKMAGPHAKRAGANLTETAAALGILANMGIRGSLAGTALGKSYKRLADPKVIQYLKEYGVETLNADGSMRRMRDTLVDIAKAMKTMTNAEQITFAEEVFDARGSLGGGTLSVNTEGIDQLMEKLKNAEGAAATAAKKMDDGIGGALRRMESAAEGVSIAFGEIVSISFVPLIEGTSNLLLGIRELIGENTALLGGLMQITATVVGFGAAIKALTLGAGVVKSLMAPIAALDAMVSGTKAAAAAAVAAEKQKELAVIASTAKNAAAEKMKTAIAEAETAKRTALTAQENAAALAESQSKLAANQRLIAASNTRIAQAQAESAVTGQSATAFVAAENAKQAELAETNLMLQQQIAAQNSVAVASAKGAVAAQAQATKSMQIAQSAAKASEAATAAEIAYGVSIKSSSALVAGKAAHIATALKTQGAAAIFAKSSSAMLASANMKTMLTAMMAAKGTKTVTVALYAQAVGAKVAAGAMTGLRAIMTAIAAHPVAIAIIAVTAALWGLNKAFAASNQSAREFSEAAAKASELKTQTREKGDIRRQNSEVMFERLKQLEEISKKGKLTAEEMQEAEDLMGKLGPGANSYIQSLDKISGKLTLANDAQDQFNKNMAQAAKSEIEGEIAALEAERMALNTENEKLLSYWNHNLLSQISGRQAEAVGQIEANGEKAVGIMKKIQAQRLRLRNIDSGDKNAVN
ncbi:MAG: phage tail tape measure protein, partial [Sphaerochaetaceae bacterium]|nr:phage tail tape measure protein [Sphaerochaetaceae bacterium]